VLQCVAVCDLWGGEGVLTAGNNDDFDDEQVLIYICMYIQMYTQVLMFICIYVHIHIYACIYKFVYIYN